MYKNLQIVVAAFQIVVAAIFHNLMFVSSWNFVGFHAKKNLPGLSYQVVKMATSPEAYFDMIGFRPGDARLLAAPRRQDVFPKGVWFEGLGM